MGEKLTKDIAELIETFDGLSVKQLTDELVLVSGLVSFDAGYQGLERIVDSFELDIFIPCSYPRTLPVVKETGGKISQNYDHINVDYSFCLAVPLEQKLYYEREPNLIGFMDNLVIPFLYSYCYWNKYSKMPYGEMYHGAKGLAEYYLDLFETQNPAHTFRTVIRCLRNGYNAHIPCACGSGKKTLKCHKFETKLISNASNRTQILNDLTDIQESFT